MQFSSLGSGSRGNSTLIEADGTTILVDCGFSMRETEKRLQRLSREIEQVTAILVTHEHGDHVRGVASLAKKYNIPVWSSRGTAKAAKLEKLLQWNAIDIHQQFEINSIHVQPVPVPHDAREPCQFIFSNGDWRIGVLTDTGSITPYIEEQYSGCDAFILEANHDEEMLANGTYPPSLKHRVGGDYGHLNNSQARDLLSRIDISRLQYLVASHISDKNNTVALARDKMSEALDEDASWIDVASQDEGLDWRVLKHTL
ncbi:MAG: MBL fold metallo-hydrolase [Gammaproteobacteria bacterium]|nr:MBL fold metallo-hydrolase [Gammaproteobacteria bacterium]MCW8986794.1 MBL fold metallo-hydrolase [Gammaproteobacteria bacterium]MCW9032357.1 MBL fold metallo-hydrolase [Gammaproteobacteria bacterium]